MWGTHSIADTALIFKDTGTRKTPQEKLRSDGRAGTRQDCVLWEATKEMSTGPLGSWDGWGGGLMQMEDGVPDLSLVDNPQSVGKVGNWRWEGRGKSRVKGKEARAHS